MNDKRFEQKVESWNTRFECIADDMLKTTNEDGEYPHIDFKQLVIEYQKIVTALRESRDTPSLILVPGSPKIIGDVR